MLHAEVYFHLRLSNLSKQWTQHGVGSMRTFLALFDLVMSSMLPFRTTLIIICALNISKFTICFAICHSSNPLLSSTLSFLYAAQAVETYIVTWWRAGDGRHAGPLGPRWPGGGHRINGWPSSPPFWGCHLPHHLQAHLQGYPNRPIRWELTKSTASLIIGYFLDADVVFLSLSCSGRAGGDPFIPHRLSHKGEEDRGIFTNGPVCPGRAPAPLLHISGTLQVYYKKRVYYIMDVYLFLMYLAK